MDVDVLLGSADGGESRCGCQPMLAPPRLVPYFTDVKIVLGTSRLRSLGSRLSVKEITDLMLCFGETQRVMIDTANIYGTGSAERALATSSSRLSRKLVGPPDVSTKVGYRMIDLPWPIRFANQPLRKITDRAWRRQDFSTESLDSSFAASLRRLRMPVVDVLFLHSPSSEVILDAGVMSWLEAISTSGRSNRIGISLDSVDHLEAALGTPLHYVLQVPADLYLNNAAVFSSSNQSGREVWVNRIISACGSLLEFKKRCHELNLDPERVVVGTRSMAHLRDNLNAAKNWVRK